MGNNEKEIDIGKIQDSIGKRVRKLLSPDRCEGLTNVDIYHKIYGNTGAGEPSKKNKISALRRGEVSFNMEELIRIAHAMDVSLDWLVFGKKEPPAQDAAEKKDAKEVFTVKGFMKYVNELAKAPALNCLDIAVKYNENKMGIPIQGVFRLEAHIPCDSEQRPSCMASELLIALKRFSIALELPACTEKKLMIENTLRDIPDIEISSKKKFEPFTFTLHNWACDIDPAYEHYEEDPSLDEQELDVPPLPDGYK